jgi:hypothetical protein
MNARIFQTALCCATLTLVVGCHIRPRQGPPGTIGVQRERAVLHDPFPSNDLGPPIVGGRPLGFETPQSEPTSIQASPWANRSQRGGLFQPTYGF